MFLSLTIQKAAQFDAVRLDFGSRLNVFTGDNSLGKSVLLDVIWRKASGRWPDDTPVRPDPGGWIDCEVQNYLGRDIIDKNNNPGIRLYFSQQTGTHTSVYHTQNVYMDADVREVWNGKALSAAPQAATQPSPKDDGRMMCGGLVSDLLRWRLEDSEYYHILQDVLLSLSPPGEPLLIDRKSVRPFDNDARYVPALTTKRGLVPITLASEGIKRILSIAYLLTWGVAEYRFRAREPDARPQLYLLIDEVETHLHPKWQRVILPAILKVISNRDLFGDGPQLFVTTHAPLVLASLEAPVDPARDRLFHLRPTEDETHVAVDALVWEKHGAVGNWITSDVFGLSSEYSVEVEALRRDLTHLLTQDQQSDADVAAMTARVTQRLNPVDILYADWFDWVRRREARP